MIHNCVVNNDRIEYLAYTHLGNSWRIFRLKRVEEMLTSTCKRICNLDFFANLKRSLVLLLLKKEVWGLIWNLYFLPFPQQSLEMESLALAPFVVQIARFCSLAMVGSSIRTSKILSRGSDDPRMPISTVRTPKTRSWKKSIFNPSQLTFIF